MIYAYRGLYIAAAFVIIKLISILTMVPMAEITAYAAMVIIADQLSLNRLVRVLEEEKKRRENLDNE